MEINKILLIIAALIVVSCEKKEVSEPSSSSSPTISISSESGGGVIDIEGNTYTSIVLGNGQEWMNENLKTTVYSNGDTIPNVVDQTTWENITSGAWCYYNNDSIYENPYGKLYNWYVVDDSRNVCPTGWHIPSIDDWGILLNYLGGQNVSGGKLKKIGTLESGTGYWKTPNFGATNEINFNGVPSGKRYPDGFFAEINKTSYFWSTYQDTASRGGTLWLEYDKSRSYFMLHTFNYGSSIRCIKD